MNFSRVRFRDSVFVPGHGGCTEISGEVASIVSNERGFLTVTANGQKECAIVWPGAVVYGWPTLASKAVVAIAKGKR